MADNASQSINNPLASGGIERPRDPRPLVPSTYGAQWTFSIKAPVKFRAGSAPVTDFKQIQRDSMAKQTLLKGFFRLVFDFISDDYYLILTRESMTRTRLQRDFKSWETYFICIF